MRADIVSARTPVCIWNLLRKPLSIVLQYLEVVPVRMLGPIRRQRLADEHIIVSRRPELLGEPFQLSFQSIDLAVVQHVLEQR
jgi:hypothetical protein